jgi:hypothetical protein
MFAFVLQLSAQFSAQDRKPAAAVSRKLPNLMKLPQINED